MKEDFIQALKTCNISVILRDVSKINVTNYLHYCVTVYSDDINDKLLQLECVKILLQHRAFVDNIFLSNICKYNNIYIACFLLTDYHFDHDFRKKSSNIMSYYCCKYDRLEILKYLIENFNIEITIKHLFSAFMSFDCNNQCIEYFQQNNVKFNLAKIVVCIDSNFNDINEKNKIYRQFALYCCRYDYDFIFQIIHNKIQIDNDMMIESLKSKNYKCLIYLNSINFNFDLNLITDSIYIYVPEEKQAAVISLLFV